MANNLSSAKLAGCVDLHVHSTASDGTDTPTELVRRAAILGLSAIALTDHDTMGGLTEARAAAYEAGLELVPGCELSTMSPYGELHLLAFWPDETPQALLALDVQRQNRRCRNLEILERLASLGVNISEQQILDEATSGIVGRPHIASALLRLGVVKTRSEAFSRFLGRDGAAHVPRKLLSPLEGLLLLRSLNAVTAVAHPSLLRAPFEWLHSCMGELAAAGLDALEAYHSEYSADQTRQMVDLASEYNLLLCGGSDYHGKSKPGIALGSGKGNMRIPSYILDKLKERQAER
jgi:predicted metal-dependent phosphoesterase TrpH